MASWEQVRRVALGLPEVEEGTSYGNTAWKVRGKAFVWERPLRERELEQLGASAPPGEVLGARVEDLDAKEALLGEESGHFFTTPHFDGHPIVLVALERVGAAELRELVVEAWLARAPRRLAREYADEFRIPPPSG